MTEAIVIVDQDGVIELHIDRPDKKNALTGAMYRAMTAALAEASRRPDVAAVLLAIRWSSHSYGEVKSFCDDYDKPLIRLPAGYNTNQVAAQIMQQASGRLQ